MKHKTVSKEVQKKLPSAGAPRIECKAHWIAHIKEQFKNPRRNTWRVLFFQYLRFANAHWVAIGPVGVTWPARWIESVAKEEHPELFK